MNQQHQQVHALCEQMTLPALQTAWPTLKYAARSKPTRRRQFALWSERLPGLAVIALSFEYARATAAH